MELHVAATTANKAGEMNKAISGLLGAVVDQFYLREVLSFGLV